MINKIKMLNIFNIENCIDPNDEQSENKLLGSFFRKQTDTACIVSDSEANGRNFSFLAPLGGKKKYFQFFSKMMSLLAVGIFSDFLR